MAFSGEMPVSTVVVGASVANVPTAVYVVPTEFVAYALNEYSVAASRPVSPVVSTRSCP